jgi:hypothetical protein
MQQHQKLYTANVSLPLVVLTLNLSERLSAANAAHRVLSAQGYRIVGQHLRQGSNKRPLLRLERGDEKLRSRLVSVCNGVGDSGAEVIGRFMDVDLCWPTGEALAGSV